MKTTIQMIGLTMTTRTIFDDDESVEAISHLVAKSTELK